MSENRLEVAALQKDAEKPRRRQRQYQSSKVLSRRDAKMKISLKFIPVVRSRDAERIDDPDDPEQDKSLAW